MPHSHHAELHRRHCGWQFIVPSDNAKGVAVKSFTEFRTTSGSINAALNVAKVALIASSKELGKSICQEVGVNLDVLKDSATYLR
eukprot:6826868-Pyramimonas_sp.AAC.1